MDPGVERRIRDFYAGFGRGDFEAVLEGFHPDVRLVNPEYAVDGGVRHGRAGLRAALEALHEQFDYERIEVEHLEDGPDGALAVFRMVVIGRVSGAPLDQCFTHVFRFRDGLIGEVLWFRTLEEGRREIEVDPSANGSD
jgi:ketosteroid isomerase-like protein